MKDGYLPEEWREDRAWAEDYLREQLDVWDVAIRANGEVLACGGDAGNVWEWYNVPQYVLDGAFADME